MSHVVLREVPQEGAVFPSGIHGFPKPLFYIQAMETIV
jgi:hypothetical protein